MTAASGWLISRPVDLGVILGPALAAGVLAVLLPEGSTTPAWGYLLLVLVVDVAHVYASLWRTYLDPEERRRRPLLLSLTPLGCGAGALALHSLSPGWFWTALAYMAVFHFARQQMGIAMVYRLRAGLAMRGVGAKVERWMIYGLTGFPLLWWHTHLPRSFEWFLPGDFLPGLPPWVLIPAGAVTASLVLGHLALRLRSRRWTPGRDLWALTTAVVWFGGIVLSDSDLGFTASNVLAHGLPYFALVAWTVARKWRLTGQGPGSPRWFQGAGLVAFLAPLLALAFIEEAAWDALVWQDNEWLFGAWGLAGAFAALATPLLSVPQLTHYVLDGFIWRTGPDNPGLAEWLGAPGAHAGAPSPPRLP